jgi:hypothetical protein
MMKRLLWLILAVVCAVSFIAPGYGQDPGLLEPEDEAWYLMAYNSWLMFYNMQIGMGLSPAYDPPNWEDFIGYAAEMEAAAEWEFLRLQEAQAVWQDQTYQPHVRVVMSPDNPNVVDFRSRP